MGWENGWQLQGLFGACGLGFLLGACFDGLRMWRVLSEAGKIAVFIQDVLFGVFAAAAFFFFSLPLTGGVVRGYLLGGTVCGAIVYAGLFRHAGVRLIRRFLIWEERTFYPVGEVLDRLSAVWYRSLRKRLPQGSKMVKKCAKKTAFFLKKLLHVAG